MQTFVREALGEPIKIEPIFSQSSSTTTVNGKKTVRIKDSFQVVGSQESGVATMIADKYAKGHVHALKVQVRGITYDIDV
jgi:hypothetical protein